MMRLRRYFIALFLAILIPTAILLWRSYKHLESEAILGSKENAYLIHQILNQKLYDHLQVEEARSYSEYRFIKAVQVIGGEEVTLSDLARFPIRSHITGMVGHFQIEPDGSVKTPLMPDGLLDKIPIDNRRERERRRDQIRKVVEYQNIKAASVQKRVKARTMGLEVNSEALQERSRSGKPNLPKLLSDDQIFSKRRTVRTSQKEAIVFDVESEIALDSNEARRPRANRPYVMPSPGILQVEIDPFQARFDSEYVVFYRYVWRNNERFIQGFVVDLAKYLGSLVYGDLRFSEEEKSLCLEFSKGDSTLIRFGPHKDVGESQLLIKSELQFPLNDMNLSVYLNKSGTPPGALLLVILSLVMVLVLGGSFVGLFKIVSTQMKVSRKRQDFISAVSHELKTPLTAIQMYGEMLMNSWVTKEEKKQHYYSLIASEADRLSRLIQNVLNLSKLEKNTWQVNLQFGNPKHLLEEFARKYQNTWEHRGFVIELELDECEFEIEYDRDALFQILMNIVDNSLKFSKDAEEKKVHIRLEIIGDRVSIHIRDFGPGIPQSEVNRIFEDFYRVENEMTRTTSGTGIGLSLVKNLCKAQGIEVRVTNSNPGLRTSLEFPGTGL
jgi:signal transduction histidine kinase